MTLQRLIEAMMNETIHFFSPTKDFAPALGLMARQALYDRFCTPVRSGAIQRILRGSLWAGGQDGARFRRSFHSLARRRDRRPANRLCEALSVGSARPGA